MATDTIDTLKQEVDALKKRLEQSEHSLKEMAAEKLNSLKEYSVEHAKMAGEKTCELVREKPMLSLAGAAAVGAVSVAVLGHCLKR